LHAADTRKMLGYNPVDMADGWYIHCEGRWVYLCVVGWVLDCMQLLPDYLSIYQPIYLSVGEAGALAAINTCRVQVPRGVMGMILQIYKVS
jgi:hypothetical protein